jgi:hypothetical protein
MSTNDLRGFYLKVWYGLVQDHKMSSEEADRLCDKYQQIIADGYENGEGPAKISDQLATQDKREAHEPGTKWSAEIRVAFNDENDPNDKWVKDYEGQSVWNFFDDLSDALPAREAIKCVPDRYKDAFRDYCIYYGMECPDESSNQGDTDMGKIHMAHNRREDTNTGNRDFDQEIQALKNQKSMPDLVNALKGLSQNQLDLLELGFGKGELATKMETKREQIAAKDLLPTQNEIDVGKSLGYQVSGKNPEQTKAILKGGPVTINLPLVVYEHAGQYYIVDGHHRWSQVFLINPNCKIESIVFKNSAGDTDQDPIDMLRDFQGAIAVANGGKVPTNTVEQGKNIFDWSDDDLLKYLEGNIQDEMVQAYRDYYHSNITKENVEKSIIGNAGIMKHSNEPVPGAPSRAVMPQTDTGNNAGLKAAMQGMTDI